MADQIRLKQLGGSGLSLVLEGPDMPAQGASAPVEHRMEVSLPPGATDKVFQLLGPEWGEMRLTGRWQDAASNVFGQARELFRKAQIMVAEGQRVELVWSYGVMSSVWRRTGYLRRLVPTWLTSDRLDYEIVFAPQSIEPDIKREVSKRKAPNEAGVKAAIAAAIAQLAVTKVLTTVAAATRWWAAAERAADSGVPITQQIGSIVANSSAIPDTGFGVEAVLVDTIRQVQDAVVDIDAVVADLDTLDVQSQFSDARQLLLAGRTEREVRARMLSARASLERARADAQALLKRDPQARTYNIRSGDTLQSIAARELGDARRWRDIADANGISPSETLAAGTHIDLPARR